MSLHLPNSSGPRFRYERFIESRSQLGGDHGFEPITLPDFLFGFQRSLVEWAVRKGRAAIFADTGLGKTAMQLVWADNVVRKSARPVLIVTMLGISAQTIDEAAKFGIEAVRSKDGKPPAGSRVVVTNYESLHRFDPSAFAGMVCDESSAIKNFDGVRASQVTEFLRMMPYRLLCTATASPNDHQELGTSSEALGDLGYMDMLARFFRSDDNSLHPFRNYPRGAPKTSAVWSFRPHAEPHFWRWVCSWARACRKPSDLGFEDGKFILPPHEIRTHLVRASRVKPGYFFEMPAKGLAEQNEEQVRSLKDRCEAAAALLTHDRPGVAWCHRNAEGDLLKRLIPGAIQISGKDHDDYKEEVFRAFAAKQIRVLVTKPRVAGYGLNWQHAAHQTYFPSHSFEQYYQAIRRLLRFGQEETVRTDLVTTEGGVEVLENIARKADQAERQYTQLVALMNDARRSERSAYGGRAAEMPGWLQREAVSA